MEKDILSALESIGLNKNETIVYLDLIKAGKSSVVGISERTRIHRPNVYDSVAKLIKRGLIKQSVGSDKKLFSAMGSSNLLNYVRQKEFELQKVLHLIEELNVNGSDSETSVVSGLEKARENIYSIISGKSILIYGMPIDLAGFREIFNDFIKKCKDKGIQVKTIYTNQINLKDTNSKFLPSKFDSKITTFISEDKILLFFWNSSNSCVLIKDKDVAEGYRNYFDVLWENAKFNKL